MPKFRVGDLTEWKYKHFKQKYKYTNTQIQIHKNIVILMKDAKVLSGRFDRMKLKIFQTQIQIHKWTNTNTQIHCHFEWDVTIHWIVLKKNTGPTIPKTVVFSCL